MSRSGAKRGENYTEQSSPDHSIFLGSPGIVKVDKLVIPHQEDLQGFLLFSKPTTGNATPLWSAASSGCSPARSRSISIQWVRVVPTASRFAKYNVAQIRDELGRPPAPMQPGGDAQHAPRTYPTLY